MARSAITVQGLDKQFLIPHQQFSTLKERALHPFQRRMHDTLQVLDDVSFDIEQGEFFGIVGRNGSGKSTLLKCLAGIYRHDAGSISIEGRLAPFIELGVGFNPDLTARENVVINAVMMGMSARQARARFDHIMQFAELEEFVDLKLKNYSSGMQVRLAFSVMVEADADVLLIDEVLAVGDAAFQQKCIDVFYRLRDEGKTIVLVTHDMGTVERFCHRAMMLREGRIDKLGDPVLVGRRYLQINFAEHVGLDAGSLESPAATIREVWTADAEGNRTDAIGHGQPLSLHAVIVANEPLRYPLVELWIADPNSYRVFQAVARTDDGLPEEIAPGETAEVTVSLTEPLLSSGKWFVGCAVKRGSAGVDIAALLERATDLVVYGQHSPQAPMGTPHTTRITTGHGTTSEVA
jgi:ABC-type polysaccharide/polyol phosphate transport system ATPase subunit